MFEINSKVNVKDHGICKVIDTGFNNGIQVWLVRSEENKNCLGWFTKDKIEKI
jgi:hypothetical protein